MILNNGNYNGVITAIELKEYTKKDNKTKFEVFKVSVRINGEKQGLKDLKATFSKEYGLKYFRDFCKVTSRELIGKPCKCTVIKKAFTVEEEDEVKEVFCNEIKYLNLVDSEGNALIMTENENKKELW